MNTILLGNDSLGEQVRLRLKQTKEDILLNFEHLDSVAYGEFETHITLSYENEMAQKKGLTWSEYVFKDIPAGAAVAILAKLENDIVKAQYESLKWLAASL